MREGRYAEALASLGRINKAFERRAEVDALIERAKLAKAKDEEEERAERERLASRKFVTISSEQLAKKILYAVPNEHEFFDTKYKGKYVRWRAKYERVGLTVEFVASGGRYSALSCDDFDPAHDDVARADLFARANRQTQLAIRVVQPDP